MFALILSVSVICAVVAPFYVIYKPPSIVVRYFQYRWPDVLWRVSTNSKVVALTIDDGPSQYTNEILEILKSNNATATFFIIGSQVSGNEEMLQNMIKQGNELGNHAMHDEPSRSLSDDTLASEIKAVERVNHDAYKSADVQPPPRYFRPGSGFFSQRMRNLVTGLGYQMVLGSIYPHDPQIPYWRINARHIISMLRPGSVIICHDRRSWTAPMLRKVLPEIRRKGYQVTTVTNLLKEAKS